jgi:hypothetical protein
MRENWIRFVKEHVDENWELLPCNANEDSICSLHFSLDDYHNYIGTLSLKHLAMPKIMPYEKEKTYSVSHFYIKTICS